MKMVIIKVWSIIRSIWFIILTLIVFYAMDLALTLRAPVERSLYFQKNDFEKVIISHGGVKEFEKVLYGNSALISSYIEKRSDSGYINFGIDYGTVSDLWKMLNRRDLEVTRELVIGLNCFVLLDTLDTNPTYAWHRTALEPYVFFQRDRISPVLESMADNILNGDRVFSLTRHSSLNRTVYHGVMTDAELAEKNAVNQELFWWQGIESYAKNLRDLEKVIGWCEENGVRLRVFWQPWNSGVETPGNPALVAKRVNEILASRGVPVMDYSDSLPRKYFHDIGHLNYEYGAPAFTEVLDLWLLS